MIYHFVAAISSELCNQIFYHYSAKPPRLYVKIYTRYMFYTAIYSSTPPLAHSHLTHSLIPAMRGNTLSSLPGRPLAGPWAPI